MRILHQCGHNDVWSFQAVLEDHAGDGLILSPRHRAYEKIDQVPDALRRVSMFDPQFYIPATEAGKLLTYPFFPNNVVSSFETSEYVGKPSRESALLCVQFQEQMRFAHYVIPARHFTTNLAESLQFNQEAFVEPFLLELKSRPKRQVFLQVVLERSVVVDDEAHHQILNWATSFQEVDGVYLIVNERRTTKQSKDPDYLYRLLCFIDSLRAADMELAIGYCNTESLLLTIADPNYVTIGAYENTRVFNVENFDSTIESGGGAPKPRVYCSKLCQSIEHDYLNLIKRKVPLSRILDSSPYAIEMFKPEFNWHFSKPELYKHMFVVLGNQLRLAGDLGGKKRFEHVISVLEEARMLGDLLRSEGIVLDVNSDSSHLAAWLTAANLFGRAKGWS